ncbi:hypothetical protein BV22DRAFT_86740 [Leucogyrophana mollusca]|uniref:Uncharacterized protein n=1 Tax=Leucogyrophana mollusca TaxID=85980 RepID=A0ACB8BYB8_9AGAM|nr:hypothetical protein BV22DRAFT_86740 [Leucogyrophana mollusca]
MNYDIDDTELGNLEAGLHDHERRIGTLDSPSNLRRVSNTHAVLDRLKNNFAFSTFTTLLQGPLVTHRQGPAVERVDHRGVHVPKDGYLADETDPPGPRTRLATDVRVKRSDDQDEIMFPIDTSPLSQVSSDAASHKAPSSFSCVSSTSSFPSLESDLTPPLTPDSSNGILNSFSSSSNITSDFRPALRRTVATVPGLPSSYAEDNSGLQSQYSKEIKEGKKPERPICYDSLIEDITGVSVTSNAGVNLGDDTGDEWYGLEYTIEISRRDRRPSDNYVPSAGEYSKSRESWALIHQGTVDPCFEDQEYSRWKRWHRYLEKEDRVKMKIAHAFSACADDLAWIFVEEVKARRWMRWQKERGYASVDWEHLKEHLLQLAERRPDPYYPPEKHNLAWELKTARSYSDLRSLRPVPALC